jgi:hypothetical protein
MIAGAMPSSYILGDDIVLYRLAPAITPHHSIENAVRFEGQRDSERENAAD